MENRRMVFEFPMKAWPKERPYVARWGTHTPEKTRRFEENLALLAAAQMRVQKARLATGPLSVLINIYFERPKTPTHDYPSKCDLDNCIKSILDGLQGVAFKNDSQVIKIEAHKSWCVDDRIQVSIWEKMERKEK